MSDAGPPPFVYLASASPRRRALLTQIGIDCQLLATDVHETPRHGEGPADMVCRLALLKLRAGLSVRGPHAVPVLAADTTVSLSGEVFGKPLDEADGRRMLQRLSGRTHKVYTAVAAGDGRRERVELSCTEVSFRPLGEAEIGRYWRSGEPLGKAGGYAIQGIAAAFIPAIRGSYSGVMGLPLFETARLLEAFGLPVAGIIADA